jgi:hypothetical protein
MNNEPCRLKTITRTPELGIRLGWNSNLVKFNCEPGLCTQDINHMHKPDEQVRRLSELSGYSSRWQSATKEGIKLGDVTSHPPTTHLQQITYTPTFANFCFCERRKKVMDEDVYRYKTKTTENCNTSAESARQIEKGRRQISYSFNPLRRHISSHI